MEEKVINIIERITDFKNLRKNIDIDLFDSGILDSLAFIELINSLEDEFNIEIQPTQVSPDVWRSVKKIVGLVKSLI